MRLPFLLNLFIFFVKYMDLIDFLAISIIWDKIAGIGKQSKVPDKNSPAYRRAVYGSIAAVLAWVVAIVVIVSLW